MNITLHQTRPSGTKFEEILYGIISNYTRAVWRNIRVDTLLTKQGNTEIDILFCLKNIVFIVEAKNVSAIMGDYGDNYWSFIGSSSPTKEVREYTALNTFTQNGIHTKSFKDIYFETFKEWPIVLSVVVVPNECRLSPDLASTIYTVGSFEKVIAEISTWNMDSRVQRRVASMISGDGVAIHRPNS